MNRGNSTITRRVLVLACLCLLGVDRHAYAQSADVEASPPAATQTPPQTQPPVVDEPAAQPLIVRELSVFVLDRFGTLANNERDYGSTLFNGAYRRRPPETGKPLSTPMPLGLLTFDGPLDTPRRLRLELPGQGDAPQGKGRFLGPNQTEYCP